MPAFRRAVEAYRADMLELDVRLSADGKVVVIHDETVDRTTDGSGAVAELPWSALRDLDAGCRFVSEDGSVGFRDAEATLPLLDEVLEAFPRMRLNVEAKCREVAGPLVQRIRAHGASHRVLVAAEHEGNRRAARGYPGPWGASRSQLRPFVLLHATPFGFLYTPAVEALQVPETWKGRTIVSESFLREAHRRNIPVHVWTVDDPVAMRRLLSLGVDGIQTDRPDRLALVLHEERGRPLPPALAAA
jgi:glycerophosphoryl diester phosphodiesterase